MKISETQYKFNDEMLGSHSGQTDMKLSLEHNGDIVAHLVYTVYQGVPAISMIEVKEKRKSYGSALVKKLQSLYPDEEIEWGMTTDEGEKLRKSFNYKKVPTEHYDDFVRYKRVKKELDTYQYRANELWSKDTLSDEEKKELKSIGEKLNDLNDEVYDLEDIIDFEKPYKKIIQ